MKGWARREGYQGKRYFVLGNNWRCVVHEDMLSRNRPYRVMFNSHVESSYPTLEEAKARVIELLKQPL